MPTSYQHPDKKRKNLPAAGMAVKDQEVETAKIPYAYDPHLTPVLRFDESGATDSLTTEVEALLEKAKTGALTEKEVRLLGDALLRSRQPWLEWSTKREKKTFTVDPVALHIHEKVSARSILRAAERDDLDDDLFGTKKLDREAEKQFYQHDVDWANRLILGDSLQVMTSLARREGLAGKVQMIYIDPPYGIKFSSNWQNEVGKRDVKDGNEDLTREPEMIKAYRDTWTLGVHSYLDYLKQRLIIARELLTDSGSVFVQISDENLHRVRAVMDEVFGAENCVATILMRKSGWAASNYLPQVHDFILWYAKDKKQTRYNQILTEKNLRDLYSVQGAMKESPVGEFRPLESEERSGIRPLPSDWIFFQHDNLTSTGHSANSSGPIKFHGQEFWPGTGGRTDRHWKTVPEGIQRLISCERILGLGSTLRQKRYETDYPAVPLGDHWDDTAVSGFSDQKVYVVQTNTKALERCLLMTTRPGDLVLDPTCGSGTTAFVAEQWGRRWITIDSSRVAVAIARQRLLTAKFDTYKTKDASEGVDPDKPKNPGTGFHYKSVPHITLKSIAQNKSLDPIFEKHEPILEKRLEALNRELAKVSKELKADLVRKLTNKHQNDGPRALSDSDQRRWLLPGTDPKLIAAIPGGKGLKAITAKQAEAYREAVPDDGEWKEWQVPFDTDPDWPQPLQDALTAYRQAWRAKMDEVNACIEANAEQEELVDQPEVVRGVVRVSGPFTVESIRPLEKSLKGGAESQSPISGAPEELDSFAEGDLSCRVREGGDEEDGDSDLKVANASGHLDRMLALLRQDGLTFTGNKHISFDPLHPIESEFLHAEAEVSPAGGGEKRRAAIVIGPEHGAVTAFQATSAIFQAIARGYDDLYFAAFSFDASAQDKIQEANDNDATTLRVHMAMIRPDVLIGDLLKGNTAEKKRAATVQTTQQLFTVFGQPRTRVEKKKEGYVVHMEGMDVYDPVKNEIVDTKAGKVAAWFLDSDYDGKTFCICQAFFPDKDAWAKLAKSLRDTREEELAEILEKMSGGTSLPFTIGEHRRVAVKVIDPRGNEVLRVHRLED
ncbi:MAG: site-specific DNA-methyltransferase [Verrucomicrobiales bacterium]|nr:site-specific DNA-methyltransferase [Verrucomicrobiales bacterium]